MRKETNELFPIFLKAEELNILIVGGGNVALEKLSFLLKSSPKAKVKLLAKNYLAEVEELGLRHNIPLHIGAYHSNVLQNIQIVIAATNNQMVNQGIYDDCKSKQILVNVADTPYLCDYYLGGIVSKGNLKLGISTNGKSPTLAKRLREFFEDFLPEEMDELILNLNTYRKELKGDFSQKVKQLNEVTADLLHKK
ncbi:precorrin-2 dehydrogenase / sirohydrochlorin ferrochelatase [Lishizhenia tianjinensis]|uniref:precorrin-2 dehydrogenase n=1 Tax=Lishizhenia tianjinensis TaxID=477690 RepID=A0A1I6YE29_9FLAO|nr:bifunctional precorrin-2 dehydrogenase/sirohydrochlorin ferrochelatase [Lishizhenia tianjinensis]SFT48464.1 precorrin-2 dehydrogenase / sirohydrochlorin ferrochelatase [Lishizhenia tianjinensis]